MTSDSGRLPKGEDALAAECAASQSGGASRIAQPVPPSPTAEVELLRDRLERMIAEPGWLTFYLQKADARTILEALATPQQAEAVEALREWRPIETFAEPTTLSSGNGVLVADKDGTVGEAYFRYFADEDDGWWWSNTSWGDYPEPDRPNPTHWMPLPALPAHPALSPIKGDSNG